MYTESVMDRFVKSVNNMNSTVLVPSKLRDMDMPGHHKTLRIPPPLTNTDLYCFYVMLNDVKRELLWGLGSGVSLAPLVRYNQSRSASATTASITSSSSNSNVQQQPLATPLQQLLPSKQHVRNRSDDSLRSLGSTASSSSDQDTDSEVDSLLTERTDRENSSIVDEHTLHLAAAFRQHLQGLMTILHQLADSADYLSSRYQEDIDASSL
ncbi:hypothetical protein HDE_11393 [Halotydeus destructor]|nr:hypothetical protein HDE_11393 [Halotydeus destructor]